MRMTENLKIFSWKGRLGFCLLAAILLSSACWAESLSDTTRKVRSAEELAALREDVKKGIPTVKKVEIVSGKKFRNKESVMKIVRSRVRGLGFVFAKYKKSKPELSGTVVFRLVINPDGEVVKISTVSSTTGFKAFDESVKNSVKRWIFFPIDSGDVTVKIPFTFVK